MRKIFGIILILLVVSCSDTGTNPDAKNYSNVKDYLPMKLNSWWVYDNYELDEDGNRSGSPETEKQILDNIDVSGDTSFIHISTYDYNTDQNINEIIYKIVDNKVFSGQFFDIQMPFPIEQQEMLMLDFDKNEWEVIDLKNETIVVFNQSINVSLKGDAQKSYIEEITVKGKTISCQTVDYDFNLKADFIFNDTPININTDFEAKVWLGVKTGIVKVETDPIEINMVVFQQTIPAQENILKDYDIK